jgi:hypothetical protein
LTQTRVLPYLEIVQKCLNGYNVLYVKAAAHLWAKGAPGLDPSDEWFRLRPEEEIVSGTMIPAGQIRTIDSIFGESLKDAM